MHPQFTHRVLGVRSEPLSKESHQFCSSNPPQRIHNMVAPPLFPHGWPTYDSRTLGVKLAGQNRTLKEFSRMLAVVGYGRLTQRRQSIVFWRDTLVDI